VVDRQLTQLLSTTHGHHRAQLVLCLDPLQQSCWLADEPNQSAMGSMASICKFIPLIKNALEEKMTFQQISPDASSNLALWSTPLEFAGMLIAKHKPRDEDGNYADFAQKTCLRADA
jgi:hypothetical protein